MTLHLQDFEVEDEDRIRLVAFNNIKLGTERRYLVKNLIPRTGLLVVWGPPKCGKSFWTFDLAMHVALDKEYRGRRVQQGSVVYCAFEGAEGFKARCAAFRQEFLSDHNEHVPFYLVPVTLDLVKEALELKDAVRQTLGESKPAVVVLDTLNRSLRGSESSDEDMTAYIRAADTLREAFGCAVIIVHHCGIAGTRPRGHTALTGAADAQLAVSRDAAENVTVRVEYMKDGPEGAEIVSRLEPVDLGTDTDGDRITSCVIVPAAGVTTADIARAAALRKVSNRALLALRALDDVVIERGQTPPSEFELPAGLRAVKADDWRDRLLSHDVVRRDGKNPRQDFKRLKDGLKARTLIGERDGLVWRASTVAA
jgi:AAA domain